MFIIQTTINNYKREAAAASRSKKSDKKGTSGLPKGSSKVHTTSKTSTHKAMNKSTSGAELDGSSFLGPTRLLYTTIATTVERRRK